MLFRHLAISVVFMFLAGCGGGSGNATAPASVRLEVVGLGTDAAGGDVVTITATVSDGAGRPLGNTKVYVTWVSAASTSGIAGLSDAHGQFSATVPVPFASLLTMSATAGPAASNTVSVFLSGDPGAQPLIAVIPHSNGEYALDCYRLDLVAGLEAVVSYDPALASGPVLAWGTFAPETVKIANTAVTAILRVACISAYPLVMSGAGDLATFSFSTGSSHEPGPIAALQVQLLDVRGIALPARTLVINSYFVDSTGAAPPVSPPVPPASSVPAGTGGQGQGD